MGADDLMTREKISSFASRCLSGDLPPVNIACERAVNLIADRFDLPESILSAKRRGRGIGSEGRHLVKWLVAEKGYPATDIAKVFDMTHGTICHSQKRISDLADAYPNFREVTESLMADYNRMLSENSTVESSE